MVELEMRKASFVENSKLGLAERWRKRRLREKLVGGFLVDIVMVTLL